MRISAACSLGGRALNAEDRLEAARRALALAERAAGVSPVAVLPGRASHGEAVLGEASGGAVPCGAPSGRAFAGGARAGAASDAARWREASGGWAVPECLAEILPRGLERGMSVGFSGSILIGLLLAGIASGSGAWSVFLGMAGVGWEAAESLGVEASRTVCVPKVGDAARTQALTAAVDGFDVAVIGSSIRLDARERRLFSKRAAVRGCLLLGEGWDCRDRVSGEVVAVEGVDRGVGHVRALLVEAASGRRRVRLRIGARGWAPAQAADGEKNEGVGRVQGGLSLVEAIPS